MKKSFKQTLSVILAVLMIVSAFSVMSVTASAAEDGGSSGAAFKEGDYLKKGVHYDFGTTGIYIKDASFSSKGLVHLTGEDYIWQTALTNKCLFMFDNSNSIIVVNPLDGMTDDPEGFYLVSGMGTEEDPFIPGMSYTAPEPTTAPVTTEPATTAPATTEPVTTEPATTEPAQSDDHAVFQKGDFIEEDTEYDFKNKTYFTSSGGSAELSGKLAIKSCGGAPNYFEFIFKDSDDYMQGIIIFTDPITTYNFEGFYISGGSGTQEDPYTVSLWNPSPQEPTTEPATTEPATTEPPTTQPQDTPYAQFEKGYCFNYFGSSVIDYKTATYFKDDSDKGVVVLSGRMKLNGCSQGMTLYTFMFAKETDINQTVAYLNIKRDASPFNYCYYISGGTGSELDPYTVSIEDPNADPDQDAADAVAELINNLPEPADVKLTDEDAIKAARTAYDALTDAQKKKVDSAVLKKLTDDEKALEELKKASLLPAPSVKNYIDAGKKQVTVDITAVKGATDYKIIYRKQGATKWTSVNTKGKTKYVVNKLDSNGAYEFRVRAYVKQNGKTAKTKWSHLSRRFIADVTLNKPTAAKGSAKVSWSKNAKASGYEVIYSTKRDMSGSKSVTVKGGSKTSYTIKNLKSGKKYYVRVRAFITKGGQNFNGPFADVKSIIVK